MIKSMDISVWGREFTLPVFYDCYQGESVIEEQILMVYWFIANQHWLLEAKSRVVSYCRTEVMEDARNQKKDNIFSYVKPECLFVKRDGKRPRIALMCKYRYDPEHGLAVVFSCDGSISVGSQDIIL